MNGLIRTCDRLADGEITPLEFRNFLAMFVTECNDAETYLLAVAIAEGNLGEDDG